MMDAEKQLDFTESMQDAEKKLMTEKGERMNSKRKGAVGEREVAAYLREHGIDAHRGQQYKGSPDSPDVTGLDGFHIEVKRVERLNIYQALAQAVRDCGNKIPIVIHRRNRDEWKVTMRLDDFMEVLNGRNPLRK